MPREAVCGPKGRPAKLRLPLFHPDCTWPQESLCPPDTNLEGTGVKDPHTLRTWTPHFKATKCLSHPDPEGETATGEMHWIQPVWSPPGWGSSWATYQHTDADTHWHTKTHVTQVTLTQRC